MKKLLFGVIAIVFLGGLLTAPASACCYTNKTVHQGVMDYEVWDFRILFQGPTTVLGHADGDPQNWHFNRFDTSTVGSYTLLRWWEPIDPETGQTAPIPYCTWIHIGWFIDPPAEVIEACWTDINGNCIYPQGVVKEPWHYVTPWPDPWLWFYYDIGYGEAELYNIYYQIFEEGFPLDQLTEYNPLLQPENMILLDPGPVFIPPGGSIGFPLPPPIQVGQWVVYRFFGECDNDFVDFGQHQIEPEGVEEPVYDLWETPEGHNTYVDFGCGSIPALPADFFEPGSEPFEGTVALRGEPLPTSHPDDLGPTDTIVRRIRAASFPAGCPSSDGPIETEIVALNLVSTAPITVYGMGDPEEWDVRVCLSEFSQPTGSMTFNWVCLEGGTFTANLPVLPKLIFTKRSDGTEVTFDFGAFGFAPIEYNIDEGYWEIDSFFHVYVSPGDVLVSNCDEELNIQIGRSAVDLIPGLQAIPCENCEGQAMDHIIPITSLLDPTGLACAQQDVWPPHPEPTTGACCWQDGSCTMESQADCENNGGTFYPGQNCADVECPTEDIPTLSEWGMIILALLLLSAGTVAVIWRRKAAIARTN